MSLRALLSTLAILLLSSGCSTIRSIQEPKVSASNTAAVAAKISLCEVATTGAAEERLGQQVDFSMSTTMTLSWDSHTDAGYRASPHRKLR